MRFSYRMSDEVYDVNAQIRTRQNRYVTRMCVSGFLMGAAIGFMQVPNLNGVILLLCLVVAAIALLYFLMNAILVLLLAVQRSRNVWRDGKRQKGLASGRHTSRHE